MVYMDLIIIFALVLALIVALFAAVTISSHYKNAERQLTSSTFISSTQAEAEQTSEATTAETTSEKSGPVYEYTFRNSAKWVEHFEKHGAVPSSKSIRNGMAPMGGREPEELARDITEAINANFPGFYNSKGKSELIKLCFPGMLESRLWISCSYESH